MDWNKIVQALAVKITGLNLLEFNKEGKFLE